MDLRTALLRLNAEISAEASLGQRYTRPITVIRSRKVLQQASDEIARWTKRQEQARSDHEHWDLQRAIDYWGKVRTLAKEAIRTENHIPAPLAYGIIRQKPTA